MIVSTRRSIFNNDADRSKFLGWIIEITLDILKTEHGMNEEANFHGKTKSTRELQSIPLTPLTPTPPLLEFCRLLTRLKTVNQLSELIENPLYSEWVELAASFTMKSFHGMTSWPAPHSMVYLMTFWSKMVLSVVSVSSSVSSNSRPKAHDRLEVIAGQVSKAERRKLETLSMFTHSFFLL